MYICPATYTNRHLHTNRHTHTQTHLGKSKSSGVIHSNHSRPNTKKNKQSKNSPNSQRSLSWHEVCFAPNASIAYFDSPPICFVSSLLDYAPSLSLTELGGEGFLWEQSLSQVCSGCYRWLQDHLGALVGNTAVFFIHQSAGWIISSSVNCFQSGLQ